jgi:hypothetical protein
VEVRQISTFWNVKIPSRSNWVPLLVTVKFKVTPAHEPGAPQSVGGLVLHDFSAHRYSVELTYVYWTISDLSTELEKFNQTK